MKGDIITDEMLKLMANSDYEPFDIYTNGKLYAFIGIEDMAAELLARREADRGWRDKLLRAFTLGREWGETYGGWFCPTDKQEKEHEDAMLSELLPEPPEDECKS